jgi:hypothetical protein
VTDWPLAMRMAVPPLVGCALLAENTA